jgi:hypothetical protein
VIVDPAEPASGVDYAAWCLFNMCRGDPQPEWKLVQTALPALSKLLHTSAQKDVLVCVCACLRCFCCSSTEQHVKIRAVIQAGVAHKLVELLGHENNQLVSMALGTVSFFFPIELSRQLFVVCWVFSLSPNLWQIGSIVSDDDDAHTQAFVDCSVLDAMEHLLTHRSRVVQRSSLWVLSNIVGQYFFFVCHRCALARCVVCTSLSLSLVFQAGNRAQAHAVLSTSRILERVLQEIHHGHPGRLEDALWW